MRSSFPRKMLALFTVVFILAYFTYRILFTIPFDLGIPNLALAILFIICEFFAFYEIVTTIVESSFFPNNKENNNAKVQKYEMVDVLITTHNEEPELLHKVINGLKRQTYPSKYINIFICDDGKEDHGMEELSKKMDVQYIRLKNNNEHKAGNLNNALKNTSAPYVVTVDADMIANENAIEVLVANIQLDEEVAFVQSPQSFYNPDSFRFNYYAENDFPDEQGYFFKILNPSKSAFNSSLYCGSNTILRRKALESIGGLPTYSVTEDFATATEMQKKGWKSKAISRTLFNGLAPYTISEFMKQRNRWCRGCLQTLKNNNFFITTKLGVKSFCDWSIVSYWMNFFARFVFLSLPLLVVFGGMIPTTIDNKALLALWFPMYILTLLSTRVLSKGTRSLVYSDVVVTIQAFKLTEAVLKELISIPIPFEITNKNKPIRFKHFSPHGIPHLIYLVLSIIALAICIITGVTYGITIVWLIMNIGILAMAVLFFIEREDKYYEDIFPLSEDVVINGEKYNTKFLSDSGLYINHKFNKDEILNIELSGVNYKGKASSVEDGLSYIKLDFADEKQFEDHLFLVYNRENFFKTEASLDVVKVFLNALSINFNFLKGKANNTIFKMKSTEDNGLYFSFKNAFLFCAGIVAISSLVLFTIAV
ncbi:glycosyltransferase family 2 protein [Methanobrevibacter sp. DSM 116169]|uniref:glycosyltransferase family 2 protein n=1 Tax=Methanobrevibacter sp. DSM 116169 TaxID=3242727 RepID=UPI0038FC5A55